MPRIKLPFFIFFLPIVIFSACNKKDKSVEHHLTVKDNITIPAAGKTTGDSQSDKQPNIAVGIDECDLYISKYQQCIAVMPIEARELAQKSLLEMASAWKEAAKGTTSKEGLAAIGKTCQKAHDAARATLSSFNCDW